MRDNLLTHIVEVRDATGRPHVHDGVCLLTRGLPPQVILKMDKVYETNARIKLRYAIAL